MRDNIKSINDNITEIVKQMDFMLSQSHLDYEIKYGGRKYHFTTPFTKTENTKFIYNKMRFINALLIDAIREAVYGSTANYLYNNQQNDHLNYAWERVLQFDDNYVSKEAIQSPIAVNEYANLRMVAHEKAKALNLDSYYVANERSCAGE